MNRHLKTQHIYRDAINLLLEGLSGIELSRAIKTLVSRDGNLLQVKDKRFDLREIDDVLLIGFGKASIPMAAALEEVLGEHFTAGLLVSNRKHKVKVKSEVIIAGHPIPDANSLLAGKAIIELLSYSKPNSLLIFLISGGGSSLVEWPVSPNITLDDFKNLNRLLTLCGATIQEINTVRKQVSAFKGGKLGALIGERRAIGLYVSDVNSGDILSLASNPLLQENPSVAAASRVIEKYGLLEQIPQSFHEVLLGGSDDPPLRLRNQVTAEIDPIVVADNVFFLQIVAEQAAKIGYLAQVIAGDVEQSYQEVGDFMLAEMRGLQGRCPNQKLCLLAGGEVRCAAHGSGLGGRNQEFVLYCAKKIAEQHFESTITIISCGTDGIDGNTSAAGAVVFSKELRFIEGHQLFDPFLLRNDSHGFQKQYGGALFTGPSGHNVRDLYLLLSNPDGT